MNAGPPARDVRDPTAGAAPLEESLEGLREAFHAHQAGFFQGLDGAVTTPMQDAFARARDAHLELGREAGLLPGPETNPDTGEVDGNRLARYREGVRLQVLEPLRVVLQKVEIGRELGLRWHGFRDGLPSLADPLPQVIHREEPPDLYGPKTGDGRLTAFRKGVIRSWRRLGNAFAGLVRGLLHLVGRRADPPPPPVQTVPLRLLARTGLLGRCLMRLEPLAEDLQQHYARPVADLAAAVATWTDGWLPAEASVRAVEGHLGTRFLQEISRDLPPLPDSEAADNGEESETPPSQEDDESQPSADPNVLSDLFGILHEALEAGSALRPPSEIRDGTKEAMELEWEELLEDTRVADSFQARANPKRRRKRVAKLLEKGKSRAESWANWHGNVLERLHLAILLLRLRETLGAAANQLMGRTVVEALEPPVNSWKEARRALRDLETEAADIFSPLDASTDPEAMARKVDGLRIRAEAAAGANLRRAFESTSPARAARQVGDQVAGDLSDALRFLPESISVPPVQEGEDRIVPTASVRHVPFREIVLQTVDVLRLEALRNASRPVTAFLQTAAEECEEIPNVVSFNLAAARDELAAAQEADLAPVLEDASSLTMDGLTRTATALEGLLRGLASPWREFTHEADGLIQESFREIHTRALAEGAVQEQMLDLRAQVRAGLRKSGDRLKAQAARVGKQAYRLLRRWRTRGVRLVHLGRAAVGTPAAMEGDAERAMDILRGIPQLLESLPLVYRRLYSFQPVTDPNLLIGREEELQWVSRKLEGWRSGRGIPCLLTGPVGVGHTSFLNVLTATRMAEDRVFRVTFQDRIGTEERLASLLAETLGLGDEGAWSLSHLRTHLLEGGAFGHPTVVLLEHLEHLFLRVPGGTDLLERFISLQAQTAGRVFWLSNTSGAAWKVIEKSEPRAAVLLAQRSISTLTRPDLERVVMSRHRRSGLPVEFIPPGDSNPLLRRRLRRARGERTRQEIVREDYFDRLFRQSGGNIAMAFLHWLRSADFTTREGWLRIQASPPLRLTFLDELDLTMDFALKGFLEHGSMTLEEYGRAFGTGPEEAFQVFEGLRSRMLLESLGTRGGSSAAAQGIEEGERYRVPGILSQVVANRLRNRNILH